MWGIRVGKHVVLSAVTSLRANKLPLFVAKLRVLQQCSLAPRILYRSGMCRSCVTWQHFGDLLWQKHWTRCSVHTHWCESSISGTWPRSCLRGILAREKKRKIGWPMILCWRKKLTTQRNKKYKMRRPRQRLSKHSRWKEGPTCLHHAMSLSSFAFASRAGHSTCWRIPMRVSRLRCKQRLKVSPSPSVTVWLAIGCPTESPWSLSWLFTRAAWPNPSAWNWTSNWARRLILWRLTRMAAIQVKWHGTAGKKFPGQKMRFTSPNSKQLEIQLEDSDQTVIRARRRPMPASHQIDALTEDGDVSVRASSSLHSMSYERCRRDLLETSGWHLPPDWVRDSSLYTGLPLSEPLAMRATDFRCNAKLQKVDDQQRYLATYVGLGPKLENAAKLVDIPFKGLVTHRLDKLPLSDFRLGIITGPSEAVARALWQRINSARILLSLCSHISRPWKRPESCFEHSQHRSAHGHETLCGSERRRTGQGRHATSAGAWSDPKNDTQDQSQPHKTSGGKEAGGVFTRKILSVLSGKLGEQDSQIEVYYDELINALWKREARYRSFGGWLSVGGIMHWPAWLHHWMTCLGLEIEDSNHSFFKMFFSLWPGWGEFSYLMTTGNARDQNQQDETSRRPSQEIFGSVGRCTETSFFRSFMVWNDVHVFLATNSRVLVPFVWVKVFLLSNADLRTPAVMILRPQPRQQLHQVHLSCPRSAVPRSGIWAMPIRLARSVGNNLGPTFFWFDFWATLTMELRLLELFVCLKFDSVSHLTVSACATGLSEHNSQCSRVGNMRYIAGLSFVSDVTTVCSADLQEDLCSA